MKWLKRIICRLLGHPLRIFPSKEAGYLDGVCFRCGVIHRLKA